jgi:hypothetical protein
MMCGRSIRGGKSAHARILLQVDVSRRYYHEVTPRGSPGHDVLAVVDHAGHWLGAEAVAPGTLTPVAERAEQEGGQGFYIPATCRSAGAVRAMINDYLSDV